MIDFFAAMYEFFGWYSKGMMERLKGWDSTGTGYIASKLYLTTGFAMALFTLFIYVMQYHIIDSSRFNKKKHWWLSALVIVGVNFLIAFLLTFNVVRSGDFDEKDVLNINDCVGFAFSNALWSLIWFAILTSTPFPRKVFPSRNGNCRHTTFWKP